MALAAGTRIGVYEVIAPLGAGGMGEVYRAKDTRLGRAVALKTLPPEFALDADRRARFEREAKTLATLNHPHIAQIYGLEEVPGADGAPPTLALAMELVEGEDLAERISRGPVPLDEALPLARQIAEGLEAAHEAGIVHRDLKPANIRVTPDGVVKVLDFGLAKPTETGAASLMATHSPTLTSPALTTRGVVLGTASYMAPEQAKGKPVDRRADIWAFGCVLYELLTGRRAFEGEDVPEILGAIIKTEPDWTRLPASTPRHLRTLLVRCLAKDRTLRLQHIGDARLELRDVLIDVDAGAAAPTVASVRLPWALAALAAVVATAAIAALVARPVSGPAAPAPVVRFSIPLAADQQFTNLGRHVVALSPDGSTLVYVANQRLYQRRLDSVESSVIPGTETKTGVLEPVFSPDGQSVAFYSNDDRAIRRTRLDGSGSQTLCSAKVVFGMSWAPEGLFFGQAGEGIMRVDANGGTPQKVVPIQEPAEAAAPHLLPGGEWLVFTLTEQSGAGRWDQARVVAQSLKSGERKVLVPEASDSAFASGWLFFRSRRAVFVTEVDPSTAQTAGGPVALADGLRVPYAPEANPPTAQYAVSASGVFVSLQGPEPTSVTQRQLAILDEDGGGTPLGLPPANYVVPRVSPDGRLVAFETGVSPNRALWVHEIGEAGAPRRLTFDGDNSTPAWSADGRWIYFLSVPPRGPAGIYRQRADGSGQPQALKSALGGRGFPESIARDGSTLFFSAMSPFRLTALTLATGETQVVNDTSTATPFQATLSPDGKWLAYQVSGGAGSTVFVEPWPPTGAKYEAPHRIEAGHPVWMRGGKALMIQDVGRYPVIEVETSPSFRFGRSRDFPRGSMVTTIATSLRNHDVMPDGRRILAVVGPPGQPVSSGPTAAREIDVVLNWQALLQQPAGSP